MITREYHSWVETDNANNSTATAVRSAPSGGFAHYITGIAGSYSASVEGKTLILKQGAAEKARWYVHDSFSTEFSSPIKFNSGAAARLELAASGRAGAIGAVNMKGYTA